MAKTGRPADLSASAPESDWIDWGFRRATRAEYEASPDTVLDVVINGHYGLVDYSRNLYWVTDQHVANNKGRYSLAKISAGIVDPEGKVCTSCGQLLPLDAFYQDRRARQGRTSSCRACHRSRAEFEFNEAAIERRYAAFEAAFGAGERSVSRPGVLITCDDEGWLRLDAQEAADE